MRVVHNSLNPSLHGLNVLCIPVPSFTAYSYYLLGSVVGPLVEDDMEVREDCSDVTLQNLISDGSGGIACVWADSVIIGTTLRRKSRNISKSRVSDLAGGRGRHRHASEGPRNVHHKLCYPILP